MKRSKLFSFLLIGLIAVSAATGCRKKPVGVTNIPKGSAAIKPSGPSSGYETGLGGRYAGEDIASFETPSGLSAAEGVMNTGPRDTSILAQETVYFDLDSSLIKDSERPKLQRVAEYLIQNPTHDVMVEGHCDERGTEGYNQSLGERRALAAREALAQMGAPAGNIYTTSYGETRPADPASNEAAWRKNRRAEFVVVLPAQ